MIVYKKDLTNKTYADLASYCNQNDCHIDDKGDYLESTPNEHPESEKIKERAEELHRLLEESDWVASKITDLMVLQPEGYEDKISQYRHILEERQLYRDELNEIEN